MKKSNRYLIFSMLTVSSIALATGGVFAAASYTISDNAGSFGIDISINEQDKKITFYTPDFADTTCLSYTETKATVETGGTISDATVVPSTSPSAGFTFQGWYLEDTFETSFSTSTEILTSITLYAKFTRTNVLFDNNSSYFISSNSDQTVNTRYVYKVSNQTWGTTPTVTQANKIDLLSSSGIYKMSYAGSTWTISRKVGLQCKNNSWWGNDGYLTYLYGLNDDHNSWGDKYWQATLGGSTYVNNSSNKQGYAYIDYNLQYIGVVRVGPGAAVDLSDSNKKPTNQMGHVQLTSGFQYSVSNLFLYIPGSEGSVPSWGNGD